MCQQQLSHASFTASLQFVRFDWTQPELEQYHRPDVQKQFLKLAPPKQTTITLTLDGALVKESLGKLPVKVLHHRERVKNQIGSLYFKDRCKLSKRGSLVLFENIDKRPLFHLQAGMASRLRKYIGSAAA